MMISMALFNKSNNYYLFWLFKKNSTYNILLKSRRDNFVYMIQIQRQTICLFSFFTDVLVMMIIYKIMLSRIIFSNTRNLSRLIPFTLRAAITSSKGLNERKKKLYESQINENIKQDHSLLRQEQRRQKQANFQKFLFQIAREILQTFTSRNNLQKKKSEVEIVINKCISRLQREHRQLDARELIHFAEVVKCMALMRLEQLDQIEVVYSAMTKYMALSQQKKTLLQLSGQGWQGLSLQMRIRSVSVLQFLSPQAQKQFLAQVSPLVKYFKSAEMVVLLYEKWRYSYNLSYQTLDEIHRNEFYEAVEDVGQAYLKMLFVDSIRGEFGPHDDGMYSKVLNSINDKPSILVHSAFSKLIKMLHSQSYYVQTEVSRSNLEFSLNALINIAKNQNYEHSSLSLNQLVDIYLGFQESNSTGQILLSQITYYARMAQLQLTPQNFPLYQQLLFCVVRNLQPKLKYEHMDSLNKEYTNDTINFLREMIPKYIPLWPEVILQVNHAVHELFFNSQDPLLITFQNTYQQILEKRRKDISLSNISFLTSLLRFLKTDRNRGAFSLPDQHFNSILAQFSRKSPEAVSSSQLEILYLLQSLLGDRMIQGNFRGKLQKINQGLVEKRIQLQMSRQKNTSLINSLDDQIIWIALCSASVRLKGFTIDQSLLEIFINEKVLCMLNSFKQMEVVEMLYFVVGLSRLNPEVYQRLLFGLSTFLLQICESKRQGCQYYLNHKYVNQYSPICRLILDNPTVFKSVSNKNAFRVLQVMYTQSFDDFSSEDMLQLLEILGHPDFLTHSMMKLLEEEKFSALQLQSYEHSTSLKNFEYYNKSIQRFFEGRYNEAEVRNKLRGDTLTRQEIADYFSRYEVYKTLIKDGELNIRFQIPQPYPEFPEQYKLMYVLQRIYQRIKQFNALDFKEDFPYSSKQRLQVFQEVNFSAERNYIDQKVLSNTSINPFRIESRSLPHYIKMEVWRSYVFFSKECKVSERDLQQMKLTDVVLNKVIRGSLYEKNEKIRSVLNDFSCDEDLTAALKQARIDFEQQGAQIQIMGQDKKPLFTLLCSNNTNYKILYICAYFMAKHGDPVVVLKDSHQKESVVRFLKKNFLQKAEKKTQVQEQQKSDVQE